MPRDHDDGTFDLAAELAAGNIEIVQPGTPEADAFDLEMAEQLPEYDARMLAEEGPDALTSARHLRQAALIAERNPDLLGHALAAWCRARGWERADLADFLGVTVDQLAAMALVPTCQAHLAERYGADASKLATVLDG
jgi:hypothetical protein